MEHKVDVSVVIPTYNRGDLIGESIGSVLSQTFSNLEVVVVDDGSTDSTKEVVSAIRDSRIRYVAQPNSGRPACARNTGMRLAKGEFIAFLDSDDVWLPDKLALQLEAFERDQSLSLVATNYSFLPKGDGTVHGQSVDFRPTLADLADANPIGNSSVLMRRSVIEDIGYLDESEKIIAIEDYDYWLRLIALKPGSVLILKEPLMLYRTHATNLSHADTDVELWEKYAVVFGKYKHLRIYGKLKRRFDRMLMLRQYDLLVHRKLALGDFLGDSRISTRTRVVRFARFLVSRLVRRS